MLTQQPATEIFAPPTGDGLSVPNAREIHTQPWPLLETLGLDAMQLESRRRRIGGSDANCIFSGDKDRILALWKEKRGEVPSEDLSGKLQVALGSWTEEFNRQWFEKISGLEVTDRGAMMECDRHPWRSATLDGLTADGSAIWEAKHTNAFAKSDDILARYMPQLQHNMAVSRRERAYLSVIFGNHKFEIFEVNADWIYQVRLFKAEERFWLSLEGSKPPTPETPAQPPAPVARREECFEGHNAWATASADWLDNRDASRKFSDAAVAIKNLIADDVARAFGHGVEAKRSRSGAITIRSLGR